MKYNVNKKCIEFMKNIQDKYIGVDGICNYNDCSRCILCAIDACCEIYNLKKVDIESELEKIDISISKGKDYPYIIFHNRHICVSTTRRMKEKNFSFIFSKLFNCGI